MAWALEQIKFFTQGCDKLTVATDHTPLVLLLGQKSLDQFLNARLFRIKQRISMWKFNIIHCPGRTNFFGDVTSQKPVSPEDDTDNEKHFVAVNLASVAVTTKEAADTAKEDASYWALHQAQVPTVQSEPPTTPFESIAADFFNLAGVHYLITVNMLSWWLDIMRAASGTPGAGAKGLIACLRQTAGQKRVSRLQSAC